LQNLLKRNSQQYQQDKKKRCTVSFDNSRHIFNPFKDYSSVIMPQGRVQSDADWNELLDEIARRIQAGTLDIMGRAAYTLSTPDAFYISPGSTPWVVNIGLGRMYVDGLLAENHGLPPGTWDPALEELSGVPQPQPTTVSNTPSIPFTSQPYLPAAAASLSGAAQYLPTGTGPYVYYLDVWKRAVTWLQDSELIDSAIGIDTSGRIQTAWQVRWTTANPTGGVTGCSIPDSEIAYPVQSTGQLTTQALPNPASGPCCLTPGSGYTGLENQFYRVQIHQGGPPGTATFKWSRENASVATSVISIATKGNAAGNQATVLKVTSLGRDQVLNFSNGNWIELLDDNVELDGMPDPNYPSGAPYTYGNPGLLCQIDYVSPTTNEIYLVTPPITDARFPVGTPATDVNTRIVRWDQAGTVYSSNSSGTQTATTYAQNTGDILTPGDGVTMLVLVNGIVATFTVSAAGGNFLAGDFWTFAARTDGTLDQPLSTAPPRGIQHHYTKLSVVTFDSSGNATNTPDCRTQFGCGCEDDCGCCTVTVGDNVNSFGTYTSIQQAIYNLPTTGGVVCILPGKYYELVVLSGLSEVTIKGSGPQTVLYPPPSRPPGTADQGGNTVAPTTQSGLNAVVTVGGSQHIELTGFTVEAPTGFTGILLDTLEQNTQIEIATAKQASMQQHAEMLAKKANTSNARAQMQTDQKAAQGFEQKPSMAMDEQLPAQDQQASGVIAQKYYGGETNWNHVGAGYAWQTPSIPASNTDVTLKDVIVTATNFPAIASVQAQVVEICDNRIFMQDTPGLWPAIYVSGSETSIARNWIGLEDVPDASIYASQEVQADLTTNFTAASAAPVGNGGIQVGGFSNTIAITENQIEGGAFNAISLGGYVLMNDGSQAAGLQGLFPAPPATAVAQSTLALPATTANSQLAADGPLQNIRIEKNQISNCGLCGIGPVGYFTSQQPETISIANLSILGNTLSSTMQAAPPELPASLTETVGYGAISLPDLQNTTIRDNVITDFGSSPGAQVCGIFILNGEQVEISRNQIVETRDWVALNDQAPPANGGQQAGIAIAVVSPPALNQTAQTWAGTSTQGVTTAGSPPIYQPAMPALRVEQNVVRIPLGYSLTAFGYGPFSITGNQFSTGGTVPWAGGTAPIALNIFVLNMGLAVEFDQITSFASLWNLSNGDYTPPSLSSVDSAMANSTCGTILFAHNLCQVETRGSGAGAPFSSFIATLDHLNYSNNLSWVDGAGVTVPGAAAGEAGTSLAALSDALLFGLSLQVTANRFQEPAFCVLASGVTVGLLNVTTDNISTMCLFARGAETAVANNLSYYPKRICSAYGNDLLLLILYGTLVSGATLPGQLAAAAAAGGAAPAPAPPAPPAPAEGAQEAEKTPAPAQEEQGAQTAAPALSLTATDSLKTTPKAVLQADSTSASGLQQLSQMHQARLAQVTRIAATITKQAGTGSAQATAAQAVVTSSQATVARVEMLKQRVTASAPAVPATGWGIYGTVYNSSNTPVQSYSLYFVDSTNTYQNTYGVAYTQADGSYQFVYTGPPAGQTAPTMPTLYLQVANASSYPIYTSATAFVPTMGTAAYQAITLPVGEKPLGKLPIVLRPVTLPVVDKNIEQAGDAPTENKG
jgi:hypothetical protein